VGVIPLVRAEVKNILIHGVGAASDASIGGFVPVDPEHFGATAQVFIGPVGSGGGGDSFAVVVCTPSWVASTLVQDWEQWDSGLTAMPDSVHTGSSYWFMRRWDQADFERAVASVCEAASPGPDWGTVASRIGRLIPWEFDYKYDAHVDRAYGEPFPPAP
jgi:hypothetical protein